MKGKIIQIKEYSIQLPDVPENKSEILFASELPRNQYWRREEFSKHFIDYNPKKTKPFAPETYYNTDGELMALSEADSLVVQRQLQLENKRRREGVYMMINGNLEWCSPSYYYNLQFCQMKDLPEKYGRFRRVQNEFLTVFEWCKFQRWITSLIKQNQLVLSLFLPALL